MKLNELKLFEEPIPTISAEEAWAGGQASADQYTPATIYFVREISPGQFEVTYDENGRRKTFGKLDKQDLQASFEPMRPNEKPDAEGFVQYRSSDVYDAFKYGGDPVKLDLGGQVVKLATGDWLLRQDDGDEFTYTVERASFFDNNFIRKT